MLECRVPTAPSWPAGQAVDVERVAVDEVALEVCRYDPVTQVLDKNEVSIGAHGERATPSRA